MKHQRESKTPQRVVPQFLLDALELRFMKNIGHCEYGYLIYKFEIDLSCLWITTSETYPVHIHSYRMKKIKDKDHLISMLNADGYYVSDTARSESRYYGQHGELPVY